MNKNILFLYPSDVLNIKHIDEQYAEEANAMRELGFATALISLENIELGLKNIPATAAEGDAVVYRGWMLSAEHYSQLEKAIQAQKFLPKTSAHNYLAAHHLPNWYPCISDLSAETVTFKLDDDLPTEIAKLDWGSYFIKDYVKSLKTSIGSIINASEDILKLTDEMKKFRGTIEGGICVRRVENYKPNSEKRYFVINNTVFSPIASETIPDIAYRCAERLSMPFFSVDIAERADGQLRVIEVGDGQVSDLVGWTTERFAEIWSH